VLGLVGLADVDALNVITATLGGRRPLLFSAWGELAVFAG